MELVLLSTLICAIGTWALGGGFGGFLLVIGIIGIITGIICAVERVNLGEYAGSRIGGFKREYKKAMGMREI